MEKQTNLLFEYVIGAWDYSNSRLSTYAQVTDMTYEDVLKELENGQNVFALIPQLKEFVKPNTELLKGQLATQDVIIDGSDVYSKAGGPVKIGPMFISEDRHSHRKDLQEIIDHEDEEDMVSGFISVALSKYPSIEHFFMQSGYHPINEDFMMLKDDQLKY